MEEPKGAKEEPASAATSRDAEIVWEYKLHEENVFYQRLNLFLVAESMLFVAFVTLLPAIDKYQPLLVASAVLGSLLTIVWLVVSRRQVTVMNHVSERAAKSIPAYSALKASRPATRVSSTTLLGYWIPVLMLLVWLVSLYATLPGKTQSPSQERKQQQPSPAPPPPAADGPGG